MSHTTVAEPKSIDDYLGQIDDVDKTRWNGILTELRGRNLLIAHVYQTRRDTAQRDFPLGANFELSSTDVFVEKALYHLEERARSYRYWAVSMLFCAGVGIGGALLYYMLVDPIAADITRAISWNYVGLVMFVLRSATVAALFGYTVYIFVSFSRAFFHEATILRNRSHSLRFGRLFVYLKFGGILNAEELTKTRADLTVRDLEEAFGWNIESSTAFKEIRAELAMEGPYGKAAELIQKGMEIAADVIKPTAPQVRPEK